MAKCNYLHIGSYNNWGTKPIGFTDLDAFQHVEANGGTGTGKSEFLKILYAQFVQHNHGCTLIDLNGDISLESLNLIPPKYRKKVVFIDPTDTDNVISINPFYKVPLDKRGLLADHFVHACESIWEHSWGERLSHYLEKVVLAILHAPDELQPTMLSINLMLSRRPHYRNAVLKHVKDPEILRFFADEFNDLTATKLKEVIMPIENKIGKVVSNQFVRNMLSPFKPTFQFKDAIANKSIVIVRLPKGTLGETPAKLMGSLIVSTVLNAAQEQDSLDHKDRIPHYLMIDEKHVLPTKALIDGYSEMRKYKLGIIITTQYTDQMPPDEVKSMLANTQTFVIFRSSAPDAKRFAEQIGHIKPHQYLDLQRGQAIIKTMYKGQPQQAVVGEIDINSDYVTYYNDAEIIRDIVREKYTRPRAEVEEAYMRWIKKMVLDPAEKAKQRKLAARRRAQAAKVVFAHQPIDDGSITRRSKEAKAKIKKICDEAAKKHSEGNNRYPVFKVPTRQRSWKARAEAKKQNSV